MQFSRYEPRLRRTITYHNAKSDEIQRPELLSRSNLFYFTTPAVPHAIRRIHFHEIARREDFVRRRHVTPSG